MMTLYLWALLAVNQAEDHQPASAMAYSEPAGVQLTLDGVVVCDENGHQIHEAAWLNQLADNATVTEVVELLGPGHLSPLSGTGGISWYFSDGSRLSTVLWPQSLQTSVKRIKPPP